MWASYCLRHETILGGSAKMTPNAFLAVAVVRVSHIHAHDTHTKEQLSPVMTGIQLRDIKSLV